MKLNNKRNKISLKASMSKTQKSLTFCLIVLQILSTRTSAFSDGNVHYDPELQDGIPVISSKSLAPEIKWHYDEDDYRAMPAKQIRRRSSELDEDDDDDRDEYKAGSSNHDSYENPAFGESRRAAKDGDEIESFFDKHLGPQLETSETGRGEDEVPINEPAARADPDDQYEAAASGPLATIFHSLLNAHKRPLVITTSEESSSTDGGSNQPPTSSSTPVASSIRGNSGYLDATPIAYFAPMATPAAMASYERPGVQANPEGGAQGQEEYGPVREIYIARRPSLLSRPLSYAPTSQSSNAHWRGMAAGSRPPYYDEQSEYSRYPAAASYAYQRGQQQQAAAPAPEEEQTVTYGLSFGGASTDLGAADEQSDGSPEDQTSADEPGYAHHQAHNMMRHTSSTRAHNNYNYPPHMASNAYMRSNQYASAMGQQQSPYHGARYHKDPSESVAQPIKYGPNQYSGGSRTSASSSQGKESSSATRQQLLAALDKQIKMNPYYRQNGISRTSNARPSGQLYSMSPKNKAHYDNDIDTYSSYHSEVDPYKSFTTSSRMISEPVLANSVQTGSTVAPSGGEGNQNKPPNQIENRGMTSGSQSSQSRQSQNQLSAQSTSNEANNNLSNLPTGPVINIDSQRQSSSPSNSDLQRNPQEGHNFEKQVNLRVRREDSDDREVDDADDDGVWVDDDEDDDNKQQSSDLNETSQEPEEEDRQDIAPTEVIKRPGAIGGPHGYEISPDDLMVYHG